VCAHAILDGVFKMNLMVSCALIAAFCFFCGVLVRRIDKSYDGLVGASCAWWSAVVFGSAFIRQLEFLGSFRWVLGSVVFVVGTVFLIVYTRSHRPPDERPPRHRSFRLTRSL
jgi:predicted membrane channel-forming protein YqfA (hemolysin III family)